MPSERAFSARPVHIEAGGRYADVQHSASRLIRSGALAASHMPTIPPSETPQYATWPRSCSFSTPSTSVASSAIVYGPGGAGDCAPRTPWPRISNRSRRNCRPSTAACGSHMPWLVPIEQPSATTGAPAGPSSEAARRSSDIEEDRLALALQPDVEPQHRAGLSHGDESLTAVSFGNRRQHGVGGVRFRLVREVQPGDQAVQQAAR